MQSCDVSSSLSLSLSLSLSPPPPPPPPSRYSSSIKRPVERGKSLQEISLGVSPGDREGGMSPDDLTRSLRREMGARFVHHRGSVRANFSDPSSSSLFSGFVRWLNRVGMEKRDYALFCLHKKGRTRRFCKKILKSRYVSRYRLQLPFLNRWKPLLICSLALSFILYIKYIQLVSYLTNKPIPLHVY